MKRLSQNPKSAAAVLLVSILAGCASFGSSGPSRSSVNSAAERSYAEGDIKIIELNDVSARRLSAYGQSRSFAEIFGESAPVATVIDRGDILDVAVWEAPPAVLFGVTGMDARLAANPLVAQSAAIPQQMVGDDGTISVPFAGQIPAAGRTAAQVERAIVARLAGKANDPQAVVRLVQNEARNVTVLGEVAGSRRVPLTARGERLLDILAAVGGPRQPVGKTTVRVSRGPTAVSMPLEAIIQDPDQNIRLRSDDVVTVLFQPFSFVALGAVGQSAEVPFEGSGLTLAQALGRIGGLRDERADIRGVFIFRLEEPAALEPGLAASARRTAEGLIPVIYRLDLSEATSFFAAQDFAVRDRDVLYVSNAPAADLQKFLTALSNVALSGIAIGNAIK